VPRNSRPSKRKIPGIPTQPHSSAKHGTRDAKKHQHFSTNLNHFQPKRTRIQLMENGTFSLSVGGPPTDLDHFQPKRTQLQPMENGTFSLSVGGPPTDLDHFQPKRTQLQPMENGTFSLSVGGSPTDLNRNEHEFNSWRMGTFYSFGRCGVAFSHRVIRL
jgi:hypothetical protein